MNFYETIKKNLKESSYYNWKRDIEDMENNDDIFYGYAENMAEQYPEQYGSDVDDVLSQLINVFKISKDSALYQYLIKWYGSEEKLLQEVRNVWDTQDAIYFETGTGYSIFDADLLGGNADGTTEREFDKFVNEQSINESEEVSFEEIIRDMENAESYEDLYNAAEKIKNDKLRADVIDGISVCEKDNDPVDVAYSVVTSDKLDMKINDLNEGELKESSFNGIPTEAYDIADEIDANASDRLQDGVNGEKILRRDDFDEEFYNAVRKVYNLPELNSVWDNGELPDGTDVSQLENDVRLILSYRGWETIFENNDDRNAAEGDLVLGSVSDPDNVESSLHDVENNWIQGDIYIGDTKYEIQAKVFDEGSQFGINNGRISKLTISKDGDTIVNYDRGWDKEPTADMEQDFNLILATIDNYRVEHPVFTESEHKSLGSYVAESDNKSYSNRTGKSELRESVKRNLKGFMESKGVSVNGMTIESLKEADTDSPMGLLGQALDTATSMGWSYDETNFAGDEIGYEFFQYSPAGEDFSFAVSCGKAEDSDDEKGRNLIEEINSYASNFDTDEHIEMWIEARANGVSGVPSTRELVNDADAIQEMLDDLASAVNKLTVEPTNESEEKPNYVMFYLNGKELGGHDLANEFAGERDSARELFASENGVKPEDIEVREVYKESDEDYSTVDLYAYGKMYYSFDKDEWNEMSDEEKQNTIMDVADQATEEEGHTVEHDEVEIIKESTKLNEGAVSNDIVSWMYDNFPDNSFYKDGKLQNGDSVFYFDKHGDMDAVKQALKDRYGDSISFGTGSSEYAPEQKDFVVIVKKGSKIK